MDDKYYCRTCNLSCPNSETFNHHNLEQHGEKKILNCTFCTATFRRADHLKRHVQSLHYNFKYSICPVCEKDCGRHDLLLKHINKKHSMFDAIYHCRQCNFECSSLKVLEEHELSHFVDKHVCEKCKATFKRRDHMLRHIRSQHMNQCIRCPVCDQGYKRKDHVVRHVREKHKMGYLNGKLVTAQDMV